MQLLMTANPSVENTATDNPNPSVDDAITDPPPQPKWEGCNNPNPNLEDATSVDPQVRSVQLLMTTNSSLKDATTDDSNLTVGDATTHHSTKVWRTQLLTTPIQVWRM